MGLVDFEFDVRSICFALLMIKKSQTRRFCFLMNLFHSAYMAVGELPAPNFIMMNIGQSTVMFPFLNITGLKFSVKGIYEKDIPCFNQKAVFAFCVLYNSSFDKFFHSRKRIKSDIKMLKETVKEENKQ